MASHSTYYHYSTLCLMGKSFHKEHQMHIGSTFRIQFRVHKIQMDLNTDQLQDLELVLKEGEDIIEEQEMKTGYH